MPKKAWVDRESEETAWPGSEQRRPLHPPNDHRGPVSLPCVPLAHRPSFIDIRCIYETAYDR